MRPTLANGAAEVDRSNLAIPPRMAKVHTVARKKIAISEFRAELGLCIERARCLSGLTADQFAAAIDCHPSRLSKWIRNVEPPQLDAVLMSPMRGFILQALAERTPGCEVEAVIRIRRRA